MLHEADADAWRGQHVANARLLLSKRRHFAALTPASVEYCHRRLCRPDVSSAAAARAKRITHDLSGWKYAVMMPAPSKAAASARRRRGHLIIGRHRHFADEINQRRTMKTSHWRSDWRHHRRASGKRCGDYHLTTIAGRYRASAK